ncbi:secreted RxLR effector protein 161-like [Malania oleifera]|uniref:secreted RxLR effector protein 161-like n=1 Tax=Malania oleifera TaxID=397392 RepID=UPI0025AE4F0D|nr:secreted RxLR effector protein 161-like [Malania oleifera]
MSTSLTSRFWLCIARCSKTDDEVRDMSKTPYASAVACLMYAIVCTRPSLAQPVSMSDPSMASYVDANYIGDLYNRKSTIGYVFTLFEGLICWRFMVQSLVALSTAGSEHMTVVEASKEALWLT